MKERMKKAIATICMAALIMTMMPANIMIAKAATIKGTKIEVNQMYTGNLATADQVDWYTFDITQQGYFQLEFGPADFGDDDINDGWRLTVLDKDGEDVNEPIYDIKTSIETVIMPYSPDTYYIKVESESSRAEYAPIDCVYQLQVKSVKSSVWEQENNDSKEKASKIILNNAKQYKGNSLDNKDVDYFKFTVPAKGKVKVKFGIDDATKLHHWNFGWNLYVFNASGTKNYDLGQFTTTKSEILEVPKGTYYLKVVIQDDMGWGSYSPTDETYNFKVSYTKTPAKPTITKITSKKKTTTIKWKKVTNATGYKVFAKVGKNGKYKVVKTIKNNKTVSFTHKKLKKGKSYYYKVQAYTTKNGMTTKSAQSKYKAIVVK